MIPIYLITAALVTSIVSGLVGMAGGIMLLSAMAIVLPFDVVVPIHGLVQLVSNVSRVLILLPNVVRPICFSFMAGAPLGGVLGYFLLSRIERPTWLLGVIAAFMLYVVFKPERLPEIRLRPRGYFVLGFLSGCTGCLIGAVDPLMAPCFVRTDLRKESMVATKAACSVAGHVTKIPVFLALQFDYGSHALLIVGMIAAVIAGSKIGTLLLQRISPERFIRLVKVAMFLIAIRLLSNVAPIPWPEVESTEIAAQLSQDVIEQVKSAPDAASAWQGVKTSSHPRDPMAFLFTYPDSRFSVAAGMRYQQLKRQRIRQVQNRLRDEGFDPGHTDGVFGPQTQAALRQYQRARGLAVSGRCDPATVEALRLEGFTTASK